MRLTSRVARHPPPFTKHRHIRRRPQGWDLDPECELVPFAGLRKCMRATRGSPRTPVSPTPEPVSSPAWPGGPATMGCLVSSPAPGAFLILSVASCAARNPAEKVFCLLSLRFLLRIHRRRDRSDTALTTVNSTPFPWTVWKHRQSDTPALVSLDVVPAHESERSAAAAMRSQLWLLAAASHLASADEAFGQDLDYRGGEAAYLVPLPRETRASTHDGANGWSPRPTDGPSVELVRRRQDWAFMKRQTSANTWVDDTTCGWRAQTVCELFASRLARASAEQYSNSGAFHMPKRVHLCDQHRPSRWLYLLRSGKSLLHRMP